MLKEMKLMKNKKRRKKEYLYTLWPRMTRLGFIGKIREESFWRSFKGGFGSITFSFSDSPLKTEVTMLSAIRFNELEDLKNRARADLSDKEKMITLSFADEYDYLRGKPLPKKWYFDDETDMEDLVEEMSAAIVDTMVPYIERYSNMERALDFMLENTMSKAHSSIDTAAINAVGLALILRKENLDNIIASKTSLLQEKGSLRIDEFLRFVDRITAHTDVHGR